MERIKSIGNRILIIILLALLFWYTRRLRHKRKYYIHGRNRTVSENNILVIQLISKHHKASVDISGAEYDFELTDAKSLMLQYCLNQKATPVQVTVKLTYLKKL